MKKIISYLNTTFKFVLTIILIQIAVIIYIIFCVYLSFLFFNKYCTITDKLGYNSFTDTLSIISHHFTEFEIIVTIIILTIITIKIWRKPI